jgi:sugar/nucleoside kinase (ribokinase family)
VSDPPRRTVAGDPLPDRPRRTVAGDPLPDRPRRTVVVGDLVSDVLAVLAAPLAAGSDTPATIRVTGGGQAANTAAWLASRRAAVTLVAAVGADAAGRDRRAELTALGVHCAVREHPDAATGSVIVLAHAEERTMVTDRGAGLLLAPQDVDAALDDVPDAAHLHLSGYTLLDAASRPAGRHALAAARARGLTTSVDAASVEPLRRVGAAAFTGWVRGSDLLLANSAEAAVLAGPAGAGDQARVLCRVVRHAVVKCGADGAVWAGADGAVATAAAEPARVVDTTGAGDAFAAGLLAAWLDGGSPAEALRAGAALGAVAVSRIGARPVG